MITKNVTTHYTPRPLQAVLHAKLKRFNVIVCHRRWGKTVFSVNELIDKGLTNNWRHPQYAYIAPTYSQAERIAWQMLKNHTKDLPGVEYNEAKLRCTIPRPHKGDFVTIYLLGAENPDSIRGMYFDGVILDEFGTMDYRVWGEVVRPALVDRGGWAIFIGTPKGKNHFYDVWQTAIASTGSNWFQAVYKASTSGVLPPEEIQALRDEMTEDEFEQEMECSFIAALQGAYWGKEMSKAEDQQRIGVVPHDSALLVDTFWDLGVDDSTSIWFVQQSRLEIRVIDYYEVSGEGLPTFAKILKEGHRRDYNYREHNWPHDGASRDLTTGQERDRAARELGIKPLIAHPRFQVADGIDAARRILSRCHFDRAKCTQLMSGDKGSRGLESLKTYQKKYDSKNKIFLNTPLHNWASHGADAFRLLAMVLKPGEDRDRRRNLPTKCISDFRIF